MPSIIQRRDVCPGSPVGADLPFLPLVKARARWCAPCLTVQEPAGFLLRPALSGSSSVRNFHSLDESLLENTRLPSSTASSVNSRRLSGLDGFIPDVNLKAAHSNVILNLQTTVKPLEIAHWVDPRILSAMWALRDVGERVNLSHPSSPPTPGNSKTLIIFFLSLYVPRTKWLVLICPWMAFLPPPS